MEPPRQRMKMALSILLRKTQVYFMLFVPRSEVDRLSRGFPKISSFHEQRSNGNNGAK